MNTIKKSNKFNIETLESISRKIEKDVYERIKPQLIKVGLINFPSELVLVGLKEEQVLEVYTIIEKEFHLIKKYPFTAYTGTTGPKLQEGDHQIPEGIYMIDYLNPNSSFYLSLKINYPNEFDQAKSQFDRIEDLGKDIFIHGKSETVGCIPIGDRAIEELFILAKHAVQNKIKVIISPWDFRSNNSFPIIPHINWAPELYQKIEQELNPIQNA